MTPSDLKNLAQNKDVYLASSLTSTIFEPPTWFHYNGQTFLFSCVVSVWWNVKSVSDQTFETQASLTNGVMIYISGQDRCDFASKGWNLKADFENDNFDSKLIFKL